MKNPAESKRLVGSPELDAVNQMISMKKSTEFADRETELEEKMDAVSRLKGKLPWGGVRDG